MTYEEFRDAWQVALRESGLPIFGVGFDETLDLRSLSREYEVRIEPIGGQDAEPFTVTAKLSWKWDALATARTRTSEEDLLRDLLADEDGDSETSRPWLRVDVELVATLPWGKPMSLPGAPVLARWFEEVTERLDRIEPLVPDEVVREERDGRLAILAWQGTPEASCSCHPDGTLKLESIDVSAWQAIELPRRWADSEREPDPHPHEQLTQMFARVKAALYAWMQATDHLRRSAT